jgi:hypothetical protein
MKPGLGSPLGAGASPCATALFLPASLSLTQGDPVSGLSLVLGFSISKPYSTLFFSQYGHAALPYWYLDGCCAASSVCRQRYCVPYLYKLFSSFLGTYSYCCLGFYY